MKHQLCNNLNINQELKTIFQQVFTQTKDINMIGELGTDQRLEIETKTLEIETKTLELEPEK